MVLPLTLFLLVFFIAPFPKSSVQNPRPSASYGTLKGDYTQPPEKEVKI